MSLKKSAMGLLILFSLVVLAGCSQDQEETVRLGLVKENAPEWEFVQEKLEDEGINLELVHFTEFIQPNRALAEGEIDLNSFQHRAYLETYNQENDTDIVPIAETIIAPMGIYSEKIDDISEFQEGDQITVPNDPTNGGRAMLLLETAGLIDLDPEAGLTPTVDDIVDNPLNLDIVPLEASQTMRTIHDVAATLVYPHTAVDAGHSPNEDAIFLEEYNEITEPYVNIIAANEGDDREVFDRIIEVYQSEETLEIIQEMNEGSYIAVWAEDDDSEEE